jgi:hypothetical protein
VSETGFSFKPEDNSCETIPPRSWYQARIAELEAKSEADRTYMNAAEAHIAGLEAAYNDVVAVNENELALRLEAEAALAERDRMLGLCYDEEMEGSWTFDGWLADLKARAKEGSGDE